MRYLPMFTDLSGRPVLLVGGGIAAAARLRLLLSAGAAVTLIADEVAPDLLVLAGSAGVVLRQRPFRAADVTGCVAVFAASGSEDQDREVAAAARAAGVPVNAVDRADLSTFIMPAIVDRGDVLIGISSSGSAPLLARWVRARIEALLPARLGRLAAFAAEFRGAVRATIASPRQRRQFWEEVVAGPVGELVLSGDEQAARERMLKHLNAPVAARSGAGIVHIVGAGPGDPDLLTLGALRLMQQADVVLHDDLVPPAILSYLRREAERIPVAGLGGSPATRQDQIHRLMVERARAGQRVLRLKGGDPSVFGRSGEEVAYLRRHGISVHVVAGVTAAAGCAAAEAFPLTHRDRSSAVVLVTGQAAAGGREPDWRALVGTGATLAIYMGVAEAGVIAARLVAAGLPAGTPVAVIENGSRPEQRVVTGRVGELGLLVLRHGIASPALIVVGDVVREARSWQDALPQAAAG